MTEIAEAIYQPLFEQLASQIAAKTRPNFSQYDMAISEIALTIPIKEEAWVKRKLRNMMEQAYGIDSLDALVDSITNK